MFPKKLIGFFLLCLGGYACMGEKIPSGGQIDPVAKVFSSKKMTLIGGELEDGFLGVGALMVDRKEILCSGTLIHPRAVLTAAHCVEEAARYRQRGALLEFRMQIPLGEGAFSWSSFEVSKGIAHPRWHLDQEQIPQDDIGLWILAKEASSFPLAPFAHGVLDTQRKGEMMHFVGFGVLQTQPMEVAASRKYSVTMPLQGILRDRVEHEAKGKSACQGDSGGAVFAQEDGEKRLLGVISYGMGRMISEDRPACDGLTVSFRVDAYAVWLQETMRRERLLCATEADCEAGKRCTEGRCVEKAPLPSASAKLCAACSTSQDCGGGGYCARLEQGYRCLQSCDGEKRCPTGYACGDIEGVRQCLPLAGACAPLACQEDAACGAGESCQAGTCRAKAVAPVVGACKACVQGRCEAGLSCLKVGAAPARCLQPCAEGVFCPQGMRCQEIGGGRFCAPREDRCGCSQDADCGSGEHCRAGQCHRLMGGRLGEACGQDAPCADGYNCLVDAQERRSCQRACGVPAQKALLHALGTAGKHCYEGRCAPGSRCVEMGLAEPLCIPLGCEFDGDCGQGGRCINVKGYGKACLCRHESECHSGHCEMSVFRGLFRQEIGACSPPPPPIKPLPCDAGTACLDAQSLTACREDSAACSCIRPRRLGEPCSPHFPCESSLQCAQIHGRSLCLQPCQAGSPEACSQEGGQCSLLTEPLKDRAFCGCQNDADCPADRFCLALFRGSLGVCERRQARSSCGDGQCTEGEDCQNCPQDCGCQPNQRCFRQLCWEAIPEHWHRPTEQAAPQCAAPSLPQNNTSQHPLPQNPCTPPFGWSCQSIASPSLLPLFLLFLVLFARRRRL